MEITIRKATVEDLDSIYSLFQELGREVLAYEFFSRVFLKNLKNKSICYYVALENGIVIGFGSMHIQRLLHHGGLVGEIQELFVSSEYQQKGIGRRLVKKMENDARNSGAELLEVTCNRKRVGAHLFYERIGFENSHLKFVKKF